MYFLRLFSGLFFDKYLRYIKLSEEFVPFTKMNLSYLLKVSSKPQRTTHGLKDRFLNIFFFNFRTTTIKHF